MSTKLVRLPYDSRLGRHIHHDPRSLQYQVPALATEFTPVRYDGVAPIMDQGALGACTGYACAALISYIDTAHPRLPITRDEWDMFARSLYSQATHVDEFEGEWPPTDTGSSGLGVAKAAQSLGFASGYLHITSPMALATALREGPVIVGTAWYNSMFDFDAQGNVFVYTRSGLVGGHEYLLDEVTGDGRFGFRNSWGNSFGQSGRFYMQQATFLSLLADAGDATKLVPVTQPAPVPVPVPEVTTEGKGCVFAPVQAVSNLFRRNP